MTLELYFVDAFALIEMVRGNPAYAPYADEALATNVLFLYETHFSVLRDDGPEKARQVLAAYRPLAQEVTDADLIDASAFRLAHAKARYSYADALGYTMAKRRGMKFLTGDKAFKGVKGVEFVR